MKWINGFSWAQDICFSFASDQSDEHTIENNHPPMRSDFGREWDEKTERAMNNVILIRYN